MGRQREFKNRETISVTLEKDELQSLEEIRWREHLDMTKVARKAILEYIRNHAEGNTTFKLDKWNEDENFQAVPTISARPEIWYNHLSDCSDKELTQIMIQTTRINQQCKSIKGLK